MIFFDANAVVKAYVSEQGSSTIRAVIARRQEHLVLSPLVCSEVLSTLAKQWRSGVLAKALYLQARSRFLAEIPRIYTVVQIADDVFQSSWRLIDQHRVVGVGASDVIHVASALKLQSVSATYPVTVISSDRGLLSVARAAGLSTFNPEMEPLAALLSKVRN